MASVPESVTKEQYLLKSTFFYNRLSENGYFDLFLKVQNFTQVEGGNINWAKKLEWGITASAWQTIEAKGIAPSLVFVHPKVLQLNPSFLKYYRSVAMIPQKGLKALSHVSNVDLIEEGKIDSSNISASTINKLATSINEVISLVLTLATDINENKIEGMMYATAGTNIDGSWRNQIGAEGERVIRKIILQELYSHEEVSSLTCKDGNTYKASSDKTLELLNTIDDVKVINLINGYSILFSSEPDVTMYDDEGGIAGIIEIKSGLDPAAALERLGAMFKSFENTLAEYPNAITILVASCITDEVNNRLGASMVVRQIYITSNITANETEKRKFVNRLRVIMKLAKGSIG